MLIKLRKQLPNYHNYLSRHYYRITVITIITLLTIPTFCVGISFSSDSLSGNLKQEEIINHYIKSKTVKKLLLKTGNKKATAIVLALTMGPLGVHRLYLGTEVKVPVIYAATLGCVGILPVTDIIAILLSKDIEKYVNNPKVIMWID